MNKRDWVHLHKAMIMMPAYALCPVSAQEWESQFNPRAAVPAFASFQEAQAKRSAAYRESLNHSQWQGDVPYGPGERQRLDWFKGRAGGPLHVFFHGGYWRGGDRKNVSLLARHLQAAGIHVVIPSYDLCPAVDLSQTVRCAREALAWIAKHAQSMGADPELISISGHSAGAHLCSMLLATDWGSEQLPKDMIKAAVFSSGVFDPAVALYISVNEEIRLTPALAQSNNSMIMPVQHQAACWVTVGGAEPWRWIELSLQYGQHLRRQGIDAAIEVIPGFNHFSILDSLEQPNSSLSRCLMAAALSPL
ncbi:MAG: alpha/beta hydrolase [Betaproteobacteria bacterium]|nr:alpha/beta hydrolase [Betaproteobacteria bacterium]